MLKKDYLSSQDVYDLIKLHTFIDVNRNFLEKWQKYLSKQESKDIKTSITIVKKAWNSIIDRTKPADCEKIYKRNKEMEVIVCDEYQKKRINERVGKLQDKMFKEDNYYRLSEVTMTYCCANCTRQDKECELYFEFSENLIPSPSGYDDMPGKRCRFAYEDKKVENKTRSDI